MNISSRTQDLLLELNEFSNRKLKDITNLSYIIEIASQNGDDELFYDLQFSAKYVNGLSKILQNNISVSKNMNGFSVAASDEDAKGKIKKEFQDNIMKFCTLLRRLLVHADNEIKAELEHKYLSLTRESMLSLNSLIYDLSWLKSYYNSKRK